MKYVITIVMFFVISIICHVMGIDVGGVALTMILIDMADRHFA